MAKHIVICDDHLLFLNGISELLQKANSSYRITTFSDMQTCKAYLIQNIPDVFICDLNINGSDGFVLLDELKPLLRNTKKIILTAYYEDFLILKANKMGVNAFLKKETSAEELVSVIETAMDKLFYVNENTSTDVGVYSAIDKPIVNKFRISKQEREVIKLIIKGLTSKEIAEALFVSKTTIDSHRKNIYKKLEINNSSSLIKFAHENNLFN